MTLRRSGSRTLVRGRRPEGPGSYRSCSIGRMEYVDGNQDYSVLAVVSVPMRRILRCRRGLTRMQCLCGTVFKYDRIRPLNEIDDSRPVLVTMYADVTTRLYW